MDKWKKRFPLVGDVFCRWGMFSEVNYIIILQGLKWFDSEKVMQEYKNIEHIPLIDWKDTSDRCLSMGHKNFIKELVRIHNLNKEN